jgi:hypothetical protein
MFGFWVPQLEEEQVPPYDGDPNRTAAGLSLNNHDQKWFRNISISYLQLFEGLALERIYTYFLQVQEAKLNGIKWEKIFFHVKLFNGLCCEEKSGYFWESLQKHLNNDLLIHTINKQAFIVLLLFAELYIRPGE